VSLCEAYVKPNGDLLPRASSLSRKRTRAGRDPWSFTMATRFPSSLQSWRSCWTILRAEEEVEVEEDMVVVVVLEVKWGRDQKKKKEKLEKEEWKIGKKKITVSLKIQP